MVRAAIADEPVVPGGFDGYGSIGTFGLKAFEFLAVSRHAVLFGSFLVDSSPRMAT